MIFGVKPQQRMATYLKTALLGLFLTDFPVFLITGLIFLPSLIEAAQLDGKRGQSSGYEYVPGEVLVKFKKDVSSIDRQRHHEEADAEVLSEIPPLRVQRVKSRRGESTEALIERYKKNPHVEYAEPNVIFRTQLIPNDPRFSELWGLNNTGQTGGTPDADIDATEAWDLNTGSPGVIVADVDTGVDYNHPDLAANIWMNPGEIPGNGIDDDGNGYIDDVHGWDFLNHDNDPMDDHGHGTHTSGTIAAVGNNGIGIVGVSWQAKIMPLKFINSTGTGANSDAALAIIYAADMGAKISSNSWACLGAPCFSQTLEDAIAYANTKGMLFVVAAGNNNNNNDTTITYPCTSTQPNVICVAATDHNDQRASFSSYGVSSVDLGAPGVNILSTVPTGNCMLCNSTGYLLLNGTSMATPHVAGSAAVALAQFPDISVAESKEIVVGSVDPIPALSGISVTGGRLNLNNALGTQFTVTASPAYQAVLLGNSADFTITVHSFNNFSAPVTLNLISPDPGITGSFDANPVTPPANNTASSTLTLSTSVPRGTYMITIQGTDPLGITHSTTLTLQVLVPDFTISANPTTQSIWPGGAASYTVTATSIDGYTAPVALSVTSPGSNISADINPNLVNLPANGSVTSTLTVTTAASITLGNYPLTIQGSDGIKINTNTVTLSVVDTSTQLQSWIGLYDPYTSYDDPVKVITDAAGNIYVTGKSDHGSNNSDYATIKYDPNGNLVWASRFDGGAKDIPVDLAVDGSGNVYVVGYSQTSPFVFGYLLVKYDSNGQQVWVRRYGPINGSAYAYALGLDHSGNVYVTGSAPGGTCDAYTTIKYDGAGNQVWVASYDYGLCDDGATSLVVDSKGNIYVTGFSQSTLSTFDIATVKYNSDGVQLWVARYGSAGPVSKGIAVDGSGNVFVTGTTGSGTATDFVTVAYDPNGAQLWESQYNNGAADRPMAIGSDAFGNVYVTGYSSNGANDDFVTIKYGPLGNQIWAARYDNGGADGANDLVIDDTGNVYVTGGSFGTTSTDFVTIKYDPQGNEVFVKRYDNPTYHYSDVPVSLALDNAKNLYVTGFTCKDNICYDRQYTTIKYASALADLSVTKADSPDPVTVGNSLTYTVTVTNGGPNTATGVALADTLPAGVTFVTATPSQGACSQASGVVSCSLGNMADAATAVVAIVVTPSASGTITNTVSVAGNETDTNTANNTASAVTTVGINAVPTVSGAAQRIDDDGSCNGSAGEVAVPEGGSILQQSICFNATLSDTNLGQTIQWQVEVRPVGTAFTNIATATSVSVSSGTVARVSVAGLLNGAAYHWQYRAVDSAGGASPWTEFGAPGNTDFSVTSPPTISSLNQRQYDGLCQGNEIVVPVGGGVVNQSICLEGNVFNANPVQLQVEIKLIGIAFTNIATHCAPSCATTGPQGTQIVTVGGLSAGASYHWQARGVNSLGAAGAWVSFGGNLETDPDFTASNTPPTIDSLQQRVYDGLCQRNEAIVPVGGSITTTSICLEANVNDADFVRLEVEVKPVGVAFDSTGLICALTCSSTVTPGPKVVTVGGLSYGNGYHWRARGVDSLGAASDWVVFGGNADPNDPDFTAVNPNPMADLSITKIDSPDPITVGNNLTYTIVVTNSGPDAATGVNLTDTLPVGLTFVSATPTQGSCGGTSTITCSLGTLTNGAGATVTIVVTPTAAGTITNTASVAGNQTDPNSANNMATASTTVDAPSCVGTGSFSLSGSVKTSAGAGISGVTITLTGPGGCVATAITNSRGKYSVTGLGNGTYMLIPSKTGYSFTPASQTKTISGRSLKNVNFTGTPTP